jgi:hypothetical protein
MERAHRLTTRRLGVIAAATALAMMVPIAPAHADYAPYHTVSYSAPKGDANVEGLVAEPSLDVTGVSIGYNNKYLRFTMDLVDPSPNPPTGFQQQDFIWRFSYGSPKVQVLVELSQFALFGQFDPDYIGYTDRGADTVGVCKKCYATVNMAKHRVEFYTSLDDFNSALSSAFTSGKTPPTLRPKAVLTVLEADTQVDVGPGLQAFPVDTAVAPSHLTFTV